MEKRPGTVDKCILFKALVSFFMAVVLFVHAPLEAEAVNLDVSVSFYDLGYTVSQYVYNTGKYYSYLIGSFNVYDSSLQSYVNKPVYLWKDTVVYPYGDFFDTRSFYADAPAVALGESASDSFQLTDESKNAHVLTAFTPSGSGAPTLGINYVPSSTGMSYSTLLPDVHLTSFDIGIPRAVSLSGSSVSVVTATCTMNFDAPLPVGSYWIPLFSGNQPSASEGALPAFLSDTARYSLFDVYTSRSRRMGTVSAVDMSVPFEYTSFYFDVAGPSTSVVFYMSFFVAEDVDKFSYHFEYGSPPPPNVYCADSNVILDELQKGNEDANQNAQDIMHGYDKTAQDKDNERFEDSRKELQEQEDSLFDSAASGFGSLDMGDYGIGKFSAMQGAFSFVSGFIQSCYVKMGDFGAVVTVGLVLLIATKVIGLFRFQVVEH